jgi:hypothetical protein
MELQELILARPDDEESDGDAQCSYCNKVSSTDNGGEN